MFMIVSGSCSNPKNKHKFIGLLMEGLEEGLYHVSQCVANADSYFVQQAMESSHVCVVAEIQIFLS